MAQILNNTRLLPKERTALLNEILQQQHQFRQNMALLHGLPEPEPPTQIEGAVTDDIGLSNGSTQASQKPPVVESIDRVATAVEAAMSKPPDKSTAQALGKVADTIGTAARSLIPAVRVVNPAPFWAKALLAAALVGGGVAAPFVASKVIEKLKAPATPTAPTVGNANILLELQRRGADTPTDLGQDIKRAFEKDPQLREKLIEDVKRTLGGNTGVGTATGR